MIPRSARETVDSLRITLQKLEQSSDTVSEGQDAAELKQILLNRIAELEALQALEPHAAATQVQSPAELPPQAVTAEENHSIEASEAARLEKLD